MACSDGHEPLCLAVRPSTIRCVDPGVTMRLERFVHAAFADGEEAMRFLGEVESGNQDRERVVAAAALAADGDLERLQQLVALSRVDWRDVLVLGGLDNAEWSAVLDDRLGAPG